MLIGNFVAHGKIISIVAKNWKRSDGRKGLIAVYLRSINCIVTFRKIVDPNLGSSGVEHYLTHEVAHAFNASRQAGLNTKSVKRYCCSRSEFLAEMAAFEYGTSHKFFRTCIFS